MRLLKTSTLKLENFIGDTVPPYVILSHTWGDDEVSLQDFERGDSISETGGFAKIKMCCQLASQDGFEYAWVDTCCIDKKDSAELSEAINSMYRWYQEADVCYAYLADVPIDDDLSAPESKFRKSRWFTRGWTLQELLAPSDVIFYSKDWTELGTKLSLATLISEVSKIHLRAIRGGFGGDLMSFSVAQRMSWASNRNTTRREDMAYSLMGIFNINMLMLYGEGQKAFLRLQEEIIRREDDHSIFAWESDNQYYRGLLASSPADFAKSAAVKRAFNDDPQQMSLTSRGLSLHVRMARFEFESASEIKRLLRVSDTIAQSIEVSMTRAFGGDEINSNCYLVALACFVNEMDDYLPESTNVSENRSGLTDTTDGRVCLLLHAEGMTATSKVYKRLNSSIPILQTSIEHVTFSTYRTIFAQVSGMDGFKWQDEPKQYKFALQIPDLSQWTNSQLFTDDKHGNIIPVPLHTTIQLKSKFDAVAEGEQPSIYFNASPWWSPDLPPPLIFLNPSNNAFSLCWERNIGFDIPTVSFYYREANPELLDYGMSQFYEEICRDKESDDWQKSSGDSNRQNWYWPPENKFVRTILKRQMISGQRYIVLSVSCDKDESVSS